MKLQSEYDKSKLIEGLQEGDILSYVFQSGKHIKKRYLRVKRVKEGVLEALGYEQETKSLKEYFIRPEHTHVLLKRVSGLEKLFYVPKDLKF